MKRRLLPPLLAGFLFLLPFMPKADAITVFDPANYTQNMRTAIEAAQDAIKQGIQIQNQYDQIAQLAKSLQNIDKGTYYQIRALIQAQTDDYNQIFSDIDAIGYGLNDISTQFGQLFPQGSDWSSIPVSSYGGYYQNWGELLRESAETAMKAQALVEKTIGYNEEVTDILQSSENAEGVVGQLQAQNQMMAVLSQQMSDLTKTLAANGRVASSAAAKAAAEEANVRELLKQMSGDLGDYKGNTTEWNGFVPPKAGQPE